MELVVSVEYLLTTRNVETPESGYISRECLLTVLVQAAEHKLAQTERQMEGRYTLPNLSPLKLEFQVEYQT